MDNDKIKLALAVKRATYEEGFSCFLLDNAVIGNCESCNLLQICEGINEVAQEYKDSTTRVVSSFKFHE